MDNKDNICQNCFEETPMPNKRVCKACYEASIDNTNEEDFDELINSIKL